MAKLFKFSSTFESIEFLCSVQNFDGMVSPRHVNVDIGRIRPIRSVTLVTKFLMENFYVYHINDLDDIVIACRSQAIHLAQDWRSPYSDYSLQAVLVLLLRFQFFMLQIKNRSILLVRFRLNPHYQEAENLHSLQLITFSVDFSIHLIKTLCCFHSVNTNNDNSDQYVNRIF